MGVSRSRLHHLVISVLFSVVSFGLLLTIHERLEGDRARTAGNSSLTARKSVKPSRSSFTCTGVKWGEDYRLDELRCSECRTCRFDNVCLNHSSLEVVFYKGSQDVIYYLEQTGKAQYDFADDFLMLGHSHIPAQVHWRPSVVSGPLPTGASFSDAPVAALASLNDFPFNFGHALFDFLLPVYNMLSVLGLYHPNFQLLLAQHQGTNPDVIKHFIQPGEDDRRMLALISQRHAFSLEDFVASEQQHGVGNSLTCFSSFVAGSTNMAAGTQRVRFLPFRTAAFMNLGIVDKKNDNVPHITMLKKEGRRIIENADDLTSQLKQRFTHAKFKTLEGRTIATMSLKEQLEAMSKTDILITPAGGTSSVLLFLPPGATAIVMNYWDDATEKSVQIDAQNYWNLEYLDMQYFPVLLEDYEHTSDRPECEKPTDDEYYSTQGALIHCNIFLKSLHRLESVVQNALHRWEFQQQRL